MKGGKGNAVKKVVKYRKINARNVSKRQENKCRKVNVGM